MRRFLLALIALSVLGFGQSTSDFVRPKIGGLSYATAFDWSANANISGGGMQFDVGYLTLPDGSAYEPWTANIKVLVQDGANAETVTATSSTCVLGNPAPCTLSASFANTHYGRTPVRSATYGLQEAINDAKALGGTVVVSPSWRGTTGQITGATGYTNVEVLDERAGTAIWYGWNGSAYVVVLGVGRLNATTADTGPLTANGAVTLNAGGTLASGQTLTNNGTISGGTINSKAPLVNVKAFGALGTGLRYQDLTVTNGSATISAAASDTPFTTAMVGWTALVMNGAAAGATLVTTISSVNVAAQTAVLAATASCGAGCPSAGNGVIEAAPDDTTAIASAVSALSKTGGILYFPAGIYVTTAGIILSGGNGAVQVLGDGDPGTVNYGYGSRLVYAGTAGGAPGAGATKTLLTMAGSGWQVNNIRLDGGGLATYDLWVKQAATGINTFSAVIRNVGFDYVKYWGTLIGGDQATAYAGSDLIGMLTLDNVWWVHNGTVCQYALSNCSGSNLNDGGGLLLNFGPGNFNVQVENSQLTADSTTLGYGAHSIYTLSGGLVTLKNMYFGPLGEANYASVYLNGGAGFEADAVYDENGQFLNAAAGSGPTILTNITVRSNTSTVGKQAMTLTAGGSRYTLRHIKTGGLPIVMADTAQVNAFDVTAGPYESAANQVASCATVQPTIAANVEKVTLNQVAQPFAVNDWVQVIEADSIYNATAQVTAIGTGACGANTYATVSFANTQPNGTSVAAGYIQRAQGIISTAASALSGGAPFVGLDAVSTYAGTNATLADALRTGLTNPSAQDAIIALSPWNAGANGASLPAILPAGTNIFDIRGGTPEFYASSYWGGERGTFCLGCGTASETPSSHNNPVAEIASTVSDKTAQRFYNTNVGGDFRSDWSFGTSTFNWEDVRTATSYCLAETSTKAPLCANNSTLKLTLGDAGWTEESVGPHTFDSTTTFTGAAALNGGATLASGQTLTNSGTISGGTVNATTLQQGGAAAALASQLPLSATSAAFAPGALAAGICATQAATTVTNATTAMVASVTPVADPGVGLDWSGIIAAGTVAVRVCNTSTASITPTSTTYNIRVIQ